MIELRFAGLALLVAVGLLLAACDDGPSPSDADADGDVDGDSDGDGDGDRDQPVEPCETNADCQDSLYCNGEERCEPESAEADARGCLAAAAGPCGEEPCSESERSCTDPCPDGDGDGHRDVSCGGDDCDDGAASRFPGNVEVCDGAGLDEDCDPATLGPDGDGDGFVSQACCNTQPSGELRCGDDCNDARATVNPSAVEACNEVDDDCDGLIDEGVLSTYYRDNDGDGYGVTSDTTQGCAASPGYAVLSGDCDDALRPINPAASELCDGVDNNCDGLTDEDCPCSVGEHQDCGEPDGAGGFVIEGECRVGSQSCSISGEWGACEGAVFIEAEGCNSRDDDCDGAADEDFECAQNASVPGINVCGHEGVRGCNSLCVWSDADYHLTESHATCDYCADSADGLLAEHPFATRDVAFSLWDDVPVVFGTGLAYYTYVSACSCGYYSGGSLHEATTELQAGAIYRQHPVQVGYDTLNVTARVQSRSGTSPPRHGWAVVLLQGEGTSYLGGAGPDLGVPLDRNGWAFEWHFSCFTCSIVNEVDQVLLRRLNADGGDPLVPVSSVGTFPDAVLSTGMATVLQEMRISITPDDPTTAPNEMLASVEIDRATGPSGVERVSCYGDACGGVVYPGDFLELGLTSSSGAGTNRSIVTIPSIDGAAGGISHGLCPE